MGKVKILVVEDEIIIADDICDILTELGYEVCEPAITYSEAVKSLAEYKPDFAIVDINLSGKKDGVDLASFVNKEYKIPFVFLTSNTDAKTVERAKKVSPGAYLVKPFSKEELYTSIEIAISNFSNNIRKNTDKIIPSLKRALLLKQKQLFIKVNFDDIIFIKSDHVYLEIVTNTNTYLVRGSLIEYQSKLDEYFVRVQRGYIVNLKHITSIDQDYINISNHKIPMGKSYRDELLSRINLG